MTRSNDTADPSELRSIFGENLRLLARRYPSVAGLCRDLGINRTQFNRYLSGESFPRPDVLHRICVFFDMDARILLERVEDLQPSSFDLLNHPALSDFFGQDATRVSPELFPGGFYRFVRQAFIDETQFVSGLVYVKREDGYTFLRGYESKRGMESQGLSARPDDREFRGLILRQEEGVAALVGHRASQLVSFNFLTPETSLKGNLWEGYATRTMRERAGLRRAARMVYEHLGDDLTNIMATARGAGLVAQDDLPTFHARLLRIGKSFT